ncbi:hypothetical protein LBMAG53_03390 [Planctomycetota bacterium]|nr:hypothetical protein LBMAG53_03390 [Planctomycetota bacterium]
MLRLILRHSAIYSIGGMAGRGVGLVTLPIIAICLDPAEIGRFDLILQAAALFALLASADLAQGIVRFFASLGRADQSRLLGAALTFTVVSSALLVVGGGLVVGLLPGLVPMRLGGWSLGLGAAIAFLLAINGILLTGLRCSLRPLPTAMIPAATALVTGGFSIACALGAAPHAEGLLAATAAGLGLSLVLLLFIGPRPAWLTGGFPILAPSLSYSIPLCLSSIGILVGQQIDRYMVAGLLDLHQAGIYGIANRLAILATLPLLGLGMAVMPIVFASAEPGRGRSLGQGHLLAVAMGAIGLCWLSFLTPNILALFGKEAFAPAVYLVPILAFAQIVTQLTPLVPGMWNRPSTWPLARLNLSLALLNPCLSMLLIPAIGLAGAACANAATAGSTWLILAWRGQRHLPVQHPWGYISAIWALAIPTSFFGILFGSSVHLVSTCLISLAIAGMVLRYRSHA